MYPVVNGIIISHYDIDPTMGPIRDPNPRIHRWPYPHPRIQTFPPTTQRRIHHKYPLPRLPRRPLMRQLDAHRARLDRLFDRKPVPIVRGTVVEATLTLVPGELHKRVDAVDEFGDFGVAGLFGDAVPIVAELERGEI